jgi:hypothetical protein
LTDLGSSPKIMGPTWRVTAAARRAAGGLSARRGTVPLVVLLVALTWPVTSLLAQANLDNSAMIGLSLAVSRGLAFGRQIVFTYGPLGFVTHPLALTPGVVLVGVIGIGLIQLAFAAVLLRGLERNFSRPLAVAAALVVVSVVTTAEPTVSAGLATPMESPLVDIAFGLVAIALAPPVAVSARPAVKLALAGGILAGLASLVKLNDGAAVIAIVAVGLLGAGARRRTLPLAALTLVLTVVIAWLALGQPLGALPDYVRNSAAVIGGNVDALGKNAMGAGGQWEVAVVILSAAILSVGAWRSLAQAPRRRRAALAAAVLLVHYFVAREMFGRYDVVHVAALVLLVPIPLMIPWRLEKRGVGLAAAAALAVASLAVLGMGGASLGSVFEPIGRASALISDIGTVLSPAHAIAQGRAGIRAADEIAPALAADLDGHCVNVEPFELSAVFAYPSWNWCPIPAMQSYTAYTTSLDDLDAASYANARTGPDAVLRQLGGTVDGRNAAWDSPAAMLSLLCHFSEVAREGIWQLLARIPDRCGAPKVLGVLRSNGVAAVAVPPEPAGMVLVAEIHGLGIGAGERLRTLFTRADVRTLSINNTVTFRVVPDTLTDGLVLDVPAGADYAPPFNLSLSAHSIEAAIHGRPVRFAVTILGVPITGP